MAAPSPLAPAATQTYFNLPWLIIQSDLGLQWAAACTVQMLSQQCSCWQRFRERPWYPSAIWRGRPITKVLPTYLKSAVACGRSFACRNCDDSVLIIIKSTCMTGRGPLMGSLFSSHWKTGARLGGRPVLGGGSGWDTHTCVCCTSCLFLQISS